MKAFLLFLFSPLLCFGAITEYLIPKMNYQKPSVSYIKGAFLLRLHEHQDLEPLKEEFSKYGISLTEFNQFNCLSPALTTTYCSATTSPYLLTQTLSHLSVYQYCLNHRINRALILESNSQISDDPHKLALLIKRLDHIAPKWDILFTDVDFHQPETGAIVIPRLAEIPQNKKVIDPGLSRVFCRYGTASFIISTSGMKKILNYYKKQWDDLPFDQVLFKIPGLQIYGTNSDLITNAYHIEEAHKDPIATRTCTKRIFKSNEELWIHPIELLTSSRFDVTAKFLYAYYQINNFKTNWHKEVYYNHLKNWVKFYNSDPLKKSYEDYKLSFDQVIGSLKERQFNEKFPIPLCPSGIAANGAHRIGASIALNQDIKVQVLKEEECKGITAKEFEEKYRLERKYLDCMAYQYAQLKENTYIVCLFPLAHEHYEQAKEILAEFGDIVYEKDILLSESGALEYIRAVNIGQWWIGSYLDDFKHSRAKTKLCFPEEQKFQHPAKVLLYECENSDILKNAKKNVRKAIGKGNEVIHINDTHDQTKIIASTVFNQNSIDFLNTKKLSTQKNFDILLQKIKRFIFENKINPETICVDSGGVLAVYGLRDTKDADILHHYALPTNAKDFDIDSHNCLLTHHVKGLDEIIFNPENHFYYEGIKFISLDLVKKFKLDRKSTKDIDDVKLIETVIK